MQAEEKYEKLIVELKKLKKLAVAFSGGVDSTFLLYAAKEALGENVLAVTKSSYLFPESEEELSRKICRELGIKQVILTERELEIAGFRENPENRCYLCKKALLEKIKEEAAKYGIEEIAEGSNADDDKDFRPGAAAIKELGVLSPLKNVCLTKAEIRKLSKERGLETWDKPSFACLATRFPYGETLTEEKIKRVGQAEKEIKPLGFAQVRVRAYGNMARIEVPEEEIEMAASRFRNEIIERVKAAGFLYVTIDLEGYHTGSMNKKLNKKGEKS